MNMLGVYIPWHIMYYIIMDPDMYYIALKDDLYSGTSLKRTPLGPKILSFIERCP